MSLTIESPAWLMYEGENCVKCRSAKQLLEKEGILDQVYVVENVPGEIISEFREKGIRSFPVFVSVYGSIEKDVREVIKQLKERN